MYWAEEQRKWRKLIVCPKNLVLKRKECYLEDRGPRIKGMISN
jgi:hypothetical protein